MHAQNIGVNVIKYSYPSATTKCYSSRKRVSEEMASNSTCKKRHAYNTQGEEVRQEGIMCKTSRRKRTKDHPKSSNTPSGKESSIRSNGTPC